MRLHQYRYEHREVVFKDQNPRLKHHTIKTWLHGLWEEKNRGTKEEADEDDDLGEAGAEDGTDSEEEDWSTDSQDWETRLIAGLEEDHPSEQDEDEDWDLQDDIHVAD